MNNSHEPNGPKPAAITFAVWRRAPLLWSIYTIALWRFQSADRSADRWRRVVEWAVFRLEEGE